MRLLDRLRREWFLARFAWHMQDYPQRAYRGIKADLRRELDVTAADVGMPAAVQGLGRPAALAARYHEELDRPVPRWATGAVAAAIVLALPAYAAAVYAMGGLDVLDAAGGGTVTTRPPGGTMTFTSTAAEISVAAHLGPTGLVAVVGLAVLAFALGARAWRLLRR